VKEEVRITKRVTTETTETPITVRKQRAIVERLNSEGGPITEAKD
jgi:stress response protein YsnF